MKVLKNTSVVVLMAAFIAVMLFPVQAAYAGTLTTPRDYLNRVKESLTSGVQHEVFFTTEGAVSGGAGNNEITLVFPDADDGGWCATAAADMTVTGITDPTGGSESATSLPGTLVGTCTQGAGASSYDTFTITGVNDLSSATKYGVRIADGTTAELGTPAASTTGLITITTNNGSTDVDSAFTSVDIISDDQVAVSADVPSSITFTLSDTTIDLGTLSTGAVSTSSHTVQTVTNASSGYTTLVYDDGNLRKGSDDINDVADGAVTAGSEEYGLSTTDSSQDIAQDAACGSAPYTASALTATQQSVAGAASGPVDETITVCYAASISASTVAGAYAHTVTYVTVGLF
ncbi:MAG: hypothetical protein WC505_00270 [Patescibacteria group bacterium]